MKLSFDKTDLVNAVNIVLKAVPSKTTMPILECILVDATGPDITLTANDMELGIETKVEGEILEKGSVAVDAKLFSEITRKLPESEVIFEADSGNNVFITCDKSDFRIAGKDADEFSYLPSVERRNYISISQFTLKEMIRQTIFSIAPGDTNKMMTGELLEVNENEFKMTSLDGHRISIRKNILRDVYPDEKVVVPGKTLSEISKILMGDAEKEVLIFFSRNHILFEFDSTIVVSRLIDGDYFKIAQMLSSDYETKIVVNKRDLLDSIERAVLLVRENDKKPIILKLEGSTLELNISSVMGTMKEEIQVNRQGKDLVIGFNPRYLIDALRVIDDEEVTLYMVSPQAPCFIRDEAENYIYLILPMNFNRVS